MNTSVRSLVHTTSSPSAAKPETVKATVAQASSGWRRAVGSDARSGSGEASGGASRQLRAMAPIPTSPLTAAARRVVLAIPSSGIVKKPAAKQPTAAPRVLMA